ncbi:unnamed protein product [Rotaria sp. Silwood2]|nr:unnamed protein product [Rotaria sp. Silwood2]CAF2502803.1 unnamed protein product [Rotaria sp. Silwood2]CAF3925596.1 unnamed protein product [Rotaria sp. Silwood2]CAF3932091.1 unnamed protein product [Rotaria sp. Silwood2]CAF4265820.1 unnamed protein product [Rotaria sp. Silwood2]
MEALFEYIDANICDLLNSNSSINDDDELKEWEFQKIYEDLITVLNITRDDPHKPFDDLISDGAMHYEMNSLEKTPNFSVSGNPESSSKDESSSPLNENNDDTECFNANEWIIHDFSSLKMRPPKLSEFLRLLLYNPRYAAYTSWVNKNEGLFKIHNPAKVASLWKKVKLRRTHGPMDYESFSRGIRYYYKSGLMIKTYRRHTYRFAQKESF